MMRLTPVSPKHVVRFLVSMKPGPSKRIQNQDPQKAAGPKLGNLPSAVREERDI